MQWVGKDRGYLMLLAAVERGRKVEDKRTKRKRRVVIPVESQERRVCR